MTAAAAGLAWLRGGVEENMRRGVMVIAAALLGVALASTCGASAARADAQAAAAAPPGIRLRSAGSSRLRG